jgi:TolB protein
MNCSLKITSILLGLAVLIVACKPSGSLSTTKSPLAPQLQSPLAPPTLSPANAALCAKYPTPPYPIILTPCPYYLTPPAHPIDLFTPQPLPTPVLPTLITGPQVAMAKGGAFKLFYISQSYKAGEVCDMHISPDGQKVAFTMCNSEGYTFVLIMDIVKGTGFRVGIPDERLVFKPTLFRGWFPDSKQVLLMGEYGILGIANTDRADFKRISPNGEIVTDAAVSLDGQRVIYTVIKGDKLEIVDTSGNLIREILSPIPKLGDRPENLTWSPDGKWIAYTWDQSAIYYAGPVWVINADTGQMKQLSPAGAYDFSPRWSPDSTTLLVVRRENTTDSKANADPALWISNLWTVNVSGNVWNQLTHLKGKSAWSPSWTPDGSTVVFMSSLSGQPDVWSININGIALQQMTSDSSIAPLSLGIVPVVTP